MLRQINVKRGEKDKNTRTDIFVVKAECKWHAGEETLPHMLNHIRREQIRKILESADRYPALNKQLVKNIDQVRIEPREVALDKARITKVTTPDGEAHDVFEGELFFVVRVPSFFKIDSQELLENLNVLFSVNCRHSSTKLTVIKYLGANAT